MPFKPGKGAIHKEWRVTAEDREKALTKRLVTCLEKLNRHAKELKELKVGQSVKVLNQAENHGKRWALGTNRYSGGSRSWSKTVCCEDGWFEECHPQEQEVFEELQWGGLGGQSVS